MTGRASDGCGAAAVRRHLPRNPFATRHVLPGRVPALDSSGSVVDPVALLDRLQALGGTAALQGPHGSGKTTLLTRVAWALERQGRLGGTVRLKTRRDAPAALSAIARARAGATVCIDSWERMGAIPAFVGRRIASIVGCGLLVTSHRDTGLPVLVRCVPTPEVLQAIVRRLPDPGEWLGSLIAAAEIDDAFAGSGGNIREALYSLYDRFEAAVRP